MDVTNKTELEVHLKSPRQIHPNRAIEKGFEQWNRFENFLKFASKKEVRDRLKEFDAPDIANYIDPDTIDKINAAKRPPLHQRTGRGGKK